MRMDSAATLSSLPSSVSHNWEYRVFPSFSREDIGTSLFSHFQKEFERKGIRLFIDRRDRRELVGPGLIEAIRRSRIALVIFSRHYASPTLRLDELVLIMKCREELGQTVMTIYYQVEPSDVRKQVGDFGSVFQKKCLGKSVEDVEKWKQALYEVTSIPGYVSRDWKNDAEMVEKVANNLSDFLYKDVPSRDFDGLVGMENHITQISSMLSLDSNDVKMVGIWGPAGIGKTTIARALYRKLSNSFIYTAFVESIRGSGEKIHSDDDHAFMLHLQEQLLSKIFNYKDLKIHNLSMAEEWLDYRKVLFVLDDVDDLKQLKAMAGDTQWFGCGSRIIITTNDKKLLNAHGIKDIYHVEFPCSSEALEIFCLSAFDQKSPYVGFEELAVEITGLAGNLPLGLSVFGSYLRGMSKGEWMHALPRLRTSLDTNIEKVIRCDYDTLCNEDKDLFLHITCFFKGGGTSNLGEYFSNLDIRRGLQILAEKSLISIENGALLVIHNLLEQLGLEISRKEYRDENGRRKLVGDSREICDVLADDTGSGSVLTAIKDDISTGERAIAYIYERSFGSLPALSHLPSTSTHQILISFLGGDVRYIFLSHMLMVLRNKGITPFDENDIIIERGMLPICPKHDEAIKGSVISIVIISNNYASSRWCLEELVEIMKCRKELIQTVIPIFYQVEPSDVKRQRRHFGSVFKKRCLGESVEDVEKWKQALYEVASIPGYVSRDWKNDAEMIENVANDVLNKLNMATTPRGFGGLVGMENHIMQISSLLSLDSNDVRMVGIWGPAGIGKTTIARALYKKLSNSFTHTAFMESIRGSGEKIHSDDHAFMLHLQEKLLCQTFNHVDLKIHHLGVAEERLKDKKILVVLDDVDDIKQLKAMARKTQWFGKGSRIIITTSDKKLLKAHGINDIYHVEFPCSSEALEIFCLSVFDQKSPFVGFEELAMEVTQLAGDLPLGLSVFGSYLQGRSKEEWIAELPRLRTSLVPEIKEILRFDYEALWDKDKYLFLHIACFFNGKKTTNLEKHLSNLDITHGLQILTEKSLISIDKDAHLVMHSLLEQLGKEIAQKEYRDEYGRCKFVVDAPEIGDVHVNDTINFDSIVDPFTNLSPLPSSCSHIVFPSFCGVDVRKAFLPHMLKEFKNKGITVFIDNDIERSMAIGPELKEAIKGSRVSIVIISKNYASSSWCLDELVLIMKCRKELGQIVMTIFYEVEPTDVKKQKGYFGSVFEKTCMGKSVEDIKNWKQALEEVATIAGFDSTIWKNEAEMIENVATDVSNKLNIATKSRDFDGLIGMENHIMQISSLLSIGSNDVRMVGIWGPAGIGKTTIARALYKQLSYSFTHTAFMESIRGSRERIPSDDHAFMLHLQEQLLSKTFDHKDLKIHHLGVAEERLKDKKVLLVLDDVDDLRQIKAMAGKTQWFGCGSRIIMTTKDKHLLNAHGMDHIYHVNFPLLPHAYEIFCLYAFGQKSPYDGFKDLALEVTGLAGVLPLGLSVFGSYLQGRSKEEWMEALPRLKTSLDGDIEKVLRFSYEALSDKDKNLFLHIACLFEGESISYLEMCLAHSGLETKHGLKVLAEKSLISITDEHLVMHNLVEQLGKEIIRQDHKDEPERRKFLVDAREICDVLTDNRGSDYILGIDLDIIAIKDELCIDKRAFEGMTRLQFLRFRSSYSSGKNNKLIFPQGLNNLPRKLRVLRWDEFPLTCLPPDFAAGFLVILEMRNSCIEKLWKGAPRLRHLKLMDMSYSLQLKDVPNVSNATNLETLILNGCESLVEVPTWIKNLSRLTHLKMVGCKKLKVLPTNINMESLYHLDLSHCTQLKTFPEISTRIGYLDLENTGVEEVPSSIRSWPDLAKLSMRGCKSLRMFPDVLDSMEQES